MRKLDQSVGKEVSSAVAELRDGQALLLENLRFYPGEDANDGEFARQSDKRLLRAIDHRLEHGQLAGKARPAVAGWTKRVIATVDAMP